MTTSTICPRAAAACCPARATAWVALGVWFGAAVFVFARACGGHFSRGVSSLTLIGIAVVLAVIVVGVRCAVRGCGNAFGTVPRSGSAWSAQFLPSIGFGLFAVALTIAGSGATGIVLLWTIVALEFAFAAMAPRTTGWMRSRPPTSSRAAAPRVVAPLGVPESASLPLESEPEIAGPKFDQNDPCAEAIDENILDDELSWLWHEPRASQETRRLYLDDGRESIVGSLRTHLEIDRETRFVHTVFQPPLKSLPQIEIELQEPDDVRIRPAQILPHGIRWEVKSGPHAAALEVRWSFTATE